MTTSNRVAIFMAAAAFVAAAAVPAQALDADVACRAKKYKVAGVYDQCRLSEEAKALKQERATDFSRCDSILTKKWTRIDALGLVDCPDAVGAQGPVAAESAIATDSVAGSLSGSVSPDFTCETKKLRASGQYLKCRLITMFRALKKGIGPNFGGCDLVLERRWAGVDLAHDPDCPNGAGLIAPVQTAGQTHTDTAETLLSTP